MTALTDTVALLAQRHAAIVAAYAAELDASQQEAVAAEALERLGIDPAAAALTAASVPSMRLVLDVLAWAWVERQAGLLFDFSADGGSYHRSQIAASATRMRRRAEDAAGAAGLLGFWPAVEITCLVLDEDGTGCVHI